MKIVYVEDDKNIRELVLYTLRQSGYDAVGYPDGESFLLSDDKPDLLLLDIMLPKKDGLGVLCEFRSHEKESHAPVIIVSAKDSEFDKVRGLELGADDYVTKPFGMMELMARVKAVLRRIPVKQEEEAVVTLGEICLDGKKRTVTVEGTPINLTYKEFELLQYLMRNKGIVLNREQLLSAIWDYDYFGGTRTVDVHVQTLRQKLGSQKDMIETVRGVGYRLGGN